MITHPSERLVDLVHMSSATVAMNPFIFVSVVVVLGLEVLWYGWSHNRHLELLSQFRSPGAREGFKFAHKPLVLVVLVALLVASWKAWLQLSTGASITSVYLAGDPGTTSFGNIWVWKRPLQQSKKHPEQDRLVVIIPGAGFGVVPYARFAHAVSKHLGLTVVCLEDPREYTMHHFYDPYSEPCLSPRQWERLYAHALSLHAGSLTAVVDLFSHSNGSFKAAFICRTTKRAPARALFYEPMNVQSNWAPGWVFPNSMDFSERVSRYVVGEDEAQLKAAVAHQTAHYYEGGYYVERRCLLTSKVRPGLEYALDTADHDYIMCTEKLDIKLREYAESHPAEVEKRKVLRRLTHSGGHGGFIAEEHSAAQLQRVLKAWY
jgi:hypothetical protein